MLYGFLNQPCDIGYLTNETEPVRLIRCRESATFLQIIKNRAISCVSFHISMKHYSLPDSLINNSAIKACPCMPAECSTEAASSHSLTHSTHSHPFLNTHHQCRLASQLKQCTQQNKVQSTFLLPTNGCGW